MRNKLLLLMILAGPVALAQSNNNLSSIAKFFPAGAVPTGGDANVQSLVGGYIRPVGEDFGALMNNGWYSTASTHSRFGFDFSVTMNTITAKSDQKYSTPSGLTGVSYNGTIQGNNQTPTAYGPESDAPLFNFTAGNNTPILFLGPGGGNISKDIPIGSLIVPTIQAGLGLFANTDLKLRYTPAFNINGTELRNWGIGFQHDLKQHIPGIKMVPFSLSLLVAYSELTATTDLKGYYSDPTGSGQKGLGETKGYTAQILISKSLAVITFYGGIGYNNATTTYSVKGSFLVDSALGPTGNVSVPLNQAVTLKDPFTQKYTSNGFRGTAGMRLKFGPVALTGDYTLVNSKGLMTLGFGFTFR